MRVEILFSALVALFLEPIALAQAEKPDLPVLNDFLGAADFWSPELSPSGRYLSGARREDEDTFLVIFDLEADEYAPKFRSMEEYRLNWVEWVTDDRILLSLTGYMDLRTGNWLNRDDLKDLGRRQIPVPITRVLSMHRETGEMVVMFGDDRKMNKNYSLGRVVSFLPQDTDHILMTARRGGDLDLFRLDVTDGSFERIAEGTERTYSWYVDRDGEPAFRFNTNRRGTVIYIYAREDRTNGKIKWRKVKTIRLKRNRRDEAATEFSLLAAGPTETTYFVAARPDGEDKTGIYLYDFEKDEFVETIRQHPDVDVYNAIFNRETRELQAIFYHEDRLIMEYQDDEIQKHLDALNVYFGNELNVWPLMSNADGTRWLVRSVGSTDSGSYHIYHLERAQSQYLGSNKVDLAGKAFGSTQVIEYTARDGLELSGYLTRPNSVDPDVIPPLIMMPHGGPEVRDIMTFDYDVQVLVAHGYQVFQPNFRGSSGFGKAFADLGRRQWGKDMQTDVDDAFEHLVETGLAAEDQACIMGASYGGYSALAAATLTPEMYQCVVAVAAVSDLVAQLKWDRKQEGGDSEVYKYIVAHIGHPRQDREELNALSPAKLAERVTRPILLIHGKEDSIVPIEQSETMERALRKSGKAVSMVVLEDASHSYRSDADERKEYEAILEFLATHLPVDQPKMDGVSALQ